jgi:hypothetical protein
MTKPIPSPTQTHADVRLEIHANRDGMPLSMAGFLLQAIGTAYPHTEIETARLGGGINLRIPYEDFLDFDGLPDGALDSIIPDKDDPQLVAFTHGFTEGGAGISPPPWLSTLLAMSAAMMEEQLTDTVAPNYMELSILPQDGGPDFKWIICRRGKPSPHELRMKAETELAELRQRITELADHYEENGNGEASFLRDLL